LHDAENVFGFRVYFGTRTGTLLASIGYWAKWAAFGQSVSNWLVADGADSELVLMAGPAKFLASCVSTGKLFTGPTPGSIETVDTNQ
jgi:hypothetical protein